MINVLADKFLYKIGAFLPDEVNVDLYNPHQPLEAIPEGTDALLIRTTTKINPQTFPSLPENLSFVGTGSAGTDHVDQNYLKENDIAFASAAGCNARSVAEYVTVAMLLWAEQQGCDLSTLKVGIIGAGHTGGAVQTMMKNLEFETIAYDPPRGRREPGFESASVDDVLQCDILTFHVPLTRETDFPTFHWLDEQKLAGRSFSLIINASRGGVVDEQALVEACRERQVTHYVLDVWENEPVFNDESARHAFIKTPHIAGYSVQAKARASRMMAEAMMNHFSLDKSLPDLPQRETPKSSTPKTFWSLTDMLTFYHPVRDYETRFKMLIGRDDQQKKEGFQRIRSSHPLRQEFRYLPSDDDLANKYKIWKKIIAS